MPNERPDTEHARDHEWMREARRAFGMALFRVAAHSGLSTPTADESAYFADVLSGDPDYAPEVERRIRRRLSELADDVRTSRERNIIIGLDRLPSGTPASNRSPAQAGGIRKEAPSGDKSTADLST